MSAPLRALLGSTRRPRVLLVGDMILDRYQYGETRRISPEAPIPVLAATREELRLGGCGNVAANLAALGAVTSCVTVVGDDAAAEHIRELLEHAGCAIDGLVIDSERPTIRKTRIVAQNQQLLRIDEEKVGHPAADIEQALLARIEEHIGQVDIVVVSDYGKGVLSPAVLDRLLRVEGRPRVLVDPKGKDYHRYRGASLVTPNRNEAELATGRSLDDREQIRQAAGELCEQLGLDAALITLGAQGMYCREASGAEHSIPARARAVFDVTGAGDTVIATLAWALALGGDLEQAMQLATVGAGLTVQRFGVAAITRDDLLGALSDSGSSGEKVLGRAELLDRLASERARDKRIVFTNGCFDVLHVGHLAYLQEARSYGDLLVLGVNSDASVRRQGKGDDRPVNQLADRMALLAGLECVTFVTSFDEDTPEEIVKAVTPHVLVKGEDWADKGVVGREWVEAHGGHVVLAKLKQGYSTTATLARLGGRRGE